MEKEPCTNDACTIDTTIGRVTFATHSAPPPQTTLPPPVPEDSYAGLKTKYRVYRACDNTPVEDCFVLRPERDPAALKALAAYAQHCGNLRLSKDISRWIRRIYDAQAAEREK